MSIGGASPTPTPAELAALIDAARAGSVEALGLLFETARLQLLAAATRGLPERVRGKLGASDIVQQTALDAHRGIRDYQGRSPAEFFGWLRRILDNNVADVVRRYEASQKRDVDRELSLDDPEARHWAHGIRPVTRRPDDSAVRREEMRAIEQALDRLSPDQRAVVWMRHWEGMPFDRIAERLGSTEGAARKLWLRGIERLESTIAAMSGFAETPRDEAGGRP